MIEVKWPNDALSKNFSAFDKHIKNIKKVQLVKELKKEKNVSGWR